MKGYHTTSIENWTGIQKNGLLPYQVDRQEHGLALIRAGQPADLQGIWIWKERLGEASEWANVFWHVATKRTKAVVVLELLYEADDLLVRETGEPVQVHHSILHTPDSTAYERACRLTPQFDFPRVRFYEDSEAVVLMRPVPTRNIRLLKVYDLADYVEIDREREGQFVGFTPSAASPPLLPRDHLQKVFQM
jgi:hypothetical protein